MVGNRLQRVGITLMLAMSLTLGGAIVPPSFDIFFAIPPVAAQILRSDDVWRTVYERVPDLPLENQYVNREMGKVDPDNTLVGRLIRYHIYVKGRPPSYRLDWKITLADYLGVNGTMEDSTYPSHDTLRKNPLEGDIAAINRLTRAQRNALVQALVDVFTPSGEAGK